MRSLIIFIALLGTGCMSTMDKMAGIGQIEVGRSSFDKGRVVTLSKSNNYTGNDWQFASTRFGAKWQESSPESVIIFLINESRTDNSNFYTSYEGISVNIDGDIREFEASGSTIFDSSDYNTVTNTIYTSSTGVVIVPLDYLKRMVLADDVRIRVNMSDSYEDIIFSIDKKGTASYSRLKFKEFLAAI